MKILILLDITDTICKIANPFALCALLGLLVYWFYGQYKNQQIDSQLSLAFAGVIVALAAIGCLNH